jgi:hypothetical protein
MVVFAKSALFGIFVADSALFHFAEVTGFFDEAVASSTLKAFGFVAFFAVVRTLEV